MAEIHNFETTNENLLPCPFCGEEKPVWYIIGRPDAIKMHRTIVVKCPRCGTEQRTSLYRMPLRFGCINAEAAWNTREWNKED